ncbi:MAG: Fe-S-containing hydro-lyase [Dehalococcoidales bacterium]|nr:Fe-S-containing hydro-lyase [Dehalococcoidales bacterium]
MSSAVKINISSPLSDDVIATLKAGNQVRISGIIYVARDAAHARLIAALEKREKLPFDIQGQTIYYMGPSPARPGQVIGSAGPTTSGRMDMFTPGLLAAGLKAMIGKGARTPEVRAALQKYKAVYFVTTGGAAALIARTIVKSEPVAYPELGAEAILRLTVEGFPAVVWNDIYGGDLYEIENPLYRRVR